MKMQTNKQKNRIALFQSCVFGEKMINLFLLAIKNISPPFRKIALSLQKVLSDILFFAWNQNSMILIGYRKF